jgi:hypothetical protein
MKHKTSETFDRLTLLNGQLSTFEVPKAHQDVPEKMLVPLGLNPIRLLVWGLDNFVNVSFSFWPTWS